MLVAEIGDSVACDRWGFMDESVAEHIARHDPQRVLRQCEAHRRILARHQPLKRGDYLPEGAFLGDCAQCEEQSPCDDIRDLAHAYGIEVPQ